MKKYLESRGFDDTIQEEWKLEPKDKEILINYLDPEGKKLYTKINYPGGEPKYKNPSSKYLPNGHMDLYGYQMLKYINDSLLLIEGEYNCISSWIMGRPALGVSGQTGSFKEYHLKYIPQSVKKIIILYDNPKHAIERAKEILKFYDYDIDVRVAKYPDGKDANDYLKEGRTIDFQIITNMAEPFIESRIKSTDIKTYIPENDFVESYKRYTKKISDAPAKYQELIALSIVSTLLSRQVYMPWFNDSYLYPNLYIVLIGKSTVMRKSESISSAIKIIRNITPDRVFPSQFTQEALFGLLEDKPVGIIGWSEFGGFLAGATKSYMAGTKSFLTELYDCPDIIEKKLVGESYTIENPYINILSGTTINYFKEWITETDTFGGFYGRFLYMPCIPKDKNGYMVDPLEDQHTAEKNKLMLYLKEISKIKGKFTQSEESKYWLDKWLIDNNKELENFDDTDRRQSFYGRFDAYIRKLAMLYEISASGNLVISGDSAKRAIRMMNILKESLNQLIGENFAFTEEERNLQKVLKVIKEYGEPMSRKSLTLKTRIYAENLDKIVKTLIQSGEITAYSSGKGVKRATFYRIY